MLKSHWRVIARVERVMDNLFIVLAFLAAYHFRDSFVSFASIFGIEFPLEVHELGELGDYMLILGVCLPIFNGALSVAGLYRSMRFSSTFKLFRKSMLSTILVFFSASAVFFIIKQDTSRSFLGLFCVIAGICHFIERIIVLKLLRYWRIRGKNFRNLLIVGTGEVARKVYLELAAQPELGVRGIGFVDLRNQVRELKAVGRRTQGASFSDVYDLPARVVADARNFESTLKKYAVDEVLFTDVLHSYPLVQELAQIASEEGIGISFASDFFSIGIMNSDTSQLGSVPIIHYKPSPGDSSALVFKRVIDFAASAFLICAFSPIMLLTALAIKLDSPGPIFFRQKRVGLNGRFFTLLKFRSMVVDAEQRLEGLKDKNEMDGPVFKIKKDPRVTAIGKFIRRFSIDELPQLFNVLRGDMSLVGPRPPLPSEVSLYMRKQRRRLSMRPGITCIWQVSGRNEIPSFEEWAKLDLEYIDNWSLANDLKLLLRTIPAVLKGTGAR